MDQKKSTGKLFTWWKIDKNIDLYLPNHESYFDQFVFLYKLKLMLKSLIFAFCVFSSQCLSYGLFQAAEAGILRLRTISAAKSKTLKVTKGK